MTRPKIHKNILIKVSGDLVKRKKFLEFVKDKAKKNYVVIICGGGSQITAELKRAGYGKSDFNKHGRITKTWGERKIQRDVLELESYQLENRLIGSGTITVLSPILSFGSVLCPINADNMVKAGYLGFDEIYVFTLQDRQEDKEKVFEEYEKVKVLGLEPAKKKK